MADRVRVLALLVAGVLIGGCASPRPTPTPVPSQSSPAATPVTIPAGSPLTTPAASPAALSVEARDLSFAPRELTASAGADIALTLHNGGRIAHNLTIDDLDVQVVVSPGQTKTVELAGLPAGTHAFYCSVSGHRQAGMEGTLTVS